MYTLFVMLLHYHYCVSMYMLFQNRYMCIHIDVCIYIYIYIHIYIYIYIYIYVYRCVYLIIIASMREGSPRT